MQRQVTALRAALKRNRLQQKDVAAALGLSVFTLHNWTAGKATPTGDNLIKLADYLRQFEPGISERDLLQPQPQGSAA